MRRLFWVFASRTNHIVGNLMLRLNYVTENKEIYFEAYTYQVTRPLTLPLLNFPNC